MRSIMDKIKGGEEVHKRAIEKNWYFTVVIWLIICAGVLAILFPFAREKTIAQKPYASTGITKNIDERVLIAGLERELDLIPDAENGKDLTIFLPAGVNAEEVLLENRYMEGKLWVFIPCNSQEYFEECEVSGNVEIIGNASCQSLENGVLLNLQTEQLVEFSGVIENEKLVLSFENPLEQYSRIAVLDVMGESAESREVAEAVSQLVKETLSGTEVGVFLLNHAGVDAEKCLDFLEKAGADVYIQLSVDEKEDAPEEYGISCWYNEEYYIPDFGNLQLADTLAGSVAYACSNRVLGLYAVGEESFLRQLQIPGAWILVGNLANARERELLLDERYQEKIAEGISGAVLESFRVMEETNVSNLRSQNEK